MAAFETHLKTIARGWPTVSRLSWSPQRPIRFQNTETIAELAERTKTFFQAVSFCNTHPDQAFQQPIDVYSRRLIGSE